MSKKQIEYENASRYIKDKNKAIDTFYRYAISKLQEMFVYSNLPDTIPQYDFERYLLTNGNCIVAKTDNEIYALVGGFSGELDAYYHPRFYTVSNPYLNLYKDYEIDVDCVLVKNDSEMVGLRPLIMQYGVLNTEALISLNLATIIGRIQTLITAGDDRTKASADMFLTHIVNGDYGVIAESQFLDGLKAHTPMGTNTRYITQFIELIQYYKASFLNEIGLNANYNMKRERLSDNEIALNVDAILPFVDNMFDERQKAVDKINDMFDLEIVVDYNSVWKTNHEQMQQSIMASNTELDIVGETVNGDTVIVRDDNVTTDSDTVIDDTNTDSNNDSDDVVIEESEDTTDDEDDKREN